MDSLIFVSGHILDYGKTTLAESDTLQQLTIAISTARLKVKQRGKTPTIFLGIGANVTLPPNASETTGCRNAKPLKSHKPGMQRTFLNFLKTLHLKAHSTYGAVVPVDRIFTKVGRKHTAQDKSQIDFVCSDIGDEIETKPDKKIDDAPFLELRKSDHLPAHRSFKVLLSQP